jgi:osmotically-inducible protein OsmY
MPVKKPAAGAAVRTAPDAEIERKIRERFARSKAATEDKFQVRVQGGVATIEGRTDVIQRKAAATRMAKAAGARQINNRIQVSEQARQRSAANLSTGRRRAQVKRTEVSRR